MERLAFPGGLDPFDGQGRCIDLRQAAWPVVSRFESVTSNAASLR